MLCEEESKAKATAERVLQQVAAEQLQAESRQSHEVTLDVLEGGEVSWAFLGKVGDFRAVVKVKVTEDEEMFHAEAESLKELEAHGIGVPKTFHVQPHVLVLEYVLSTRVLWKTIASQVAALHSPLERESLQYGATGPRFFGLFKLEGNTPISATSWKEFWIEKRMEPAVAALEMWEGPLRERVSLLVARSRAVMKSHPYPSEAPCLLHGDLWRGNILFAKARSAQPVVFIDASTWVGQRAVEVAQMQLYGQFPPPFWNEYRRLRPLSAEMAESLPWYSLFFLLLQLWHTPRLPKSSFSVEFLVQELAEVLSYCETPPRKRPKLRKGTA